MMVVFTVEADATLSPADWAVVSPDGERVYPDVYRGYPNAGWDAGWAARGYSELRRVCATLNRSPLSYIMLRLDGLSPTEAAEHILGRTE